MCQATSLNENNNQRNAVKDNDYVDDDHLGQKLTMMMAMAVVIVVMVMAVPTKCKQRHAIKETQSKKQNSRNAVNDIHAPRTIKCVWLALSHCSSSSSSAGGGIGGLESEASAVASGGG